MATIAVRAPVRVSSAFRPSVVPWVNIDVSPSGASARSNAASTPRVGSDGVVGTFSKRSVPAGSRRTTSVKVPPTSMAIRSLMTSSLRNRTVCTRPTVAASSGRERWTLS